MVRLKCYLTFIFIIIFSACFFSGCGPLGGVVSREYCESRAVISTELAILATNPDWNGENL